MQYRNQINHASDTAFGLQSDRILPLDTAHIEQTLQDVADYLQEIRPHEAGCSARRQGAACYKDDPGRNSVQPVK